MGNVESTPIVSQVRSLVQVCHGDVEGARKTQEEFSRRCVGVSQFRSLVEAACGDNEAALRTQEAFAGGIDAIPILSQIKSAIQAGCGDLQAAEKTQQVFSKQCAIVSQVRSAVEAAAGDSKSAKDTQITFIRGPGLAHLAVPLVALAAPSLSLALGLAGAGMTEGSIIVGSMAAGLMASCKGVDASRSTSKGWRSAPVGLASSGAVSQQYEPLRTSSVLCTRCCAPEENSTDHGSYETKAIKEWQSGKDQESFLLQPPMSTVKTPAQAAAGCVIPMGGAVEASIALLSGERLEGTQAWGGPLSSSGGPGVELSGAPEPRPLKLTRDELDSEGGRDLSLSLDMVAETANEASGDDDEVPDLPDLDLSAIDPPAGLGDKGELNDEAPRGKPLAVLGGRGSQSEEVIVEGHQMQQEDVPPQLDDDFVLVGVEETLMD